MLMIQVEATSARGQASFFCDAHLLGGLSEIIKQMKETAARPNDLPHARPGIDVPLSFLSHRRSLKTKLSQRDVLTKNILLYSISKIAKLLKPARGTLIFLLCCKALQCTHVTSSLIRGDF